jgi:hypothetical protein
MYIDAKLFRNVIVKRHIATMVLFMALSTVIGLNSCAKMDNVGDQSPTLIVNIKIAAGSESTIVINDTNKVYLMYYNDDAWGSPWLQHGSRTARLINPSVSSFNTYVAAFWDAQADGSVAATNGNGILDPGEPCTGYENADPPAVMTELEFLPLEWKEISITLDTAITY